MADLGIFEGFNGVFRVVEVDIGPQVECVVQGKYGRRELAVEDLGVKDG